ncbi:MAG TPA: hypothetical protein DE179_09965 [Oceanospirillaceae bacterium]|nr:hypothetical protein [Oceanospirillaceae bacterium]
MVMVSIMPFGTLQAADTAQHLDWQWHTSTELNYCSGSYQPLMFDTLGSSLPTASQPIHTDSDTSEFDNGITTLRGNVVMQQGTQRLSSELISLDSNTDVIHIDDNVEYRRPGMLITAANGVFNMDRSQSSLQDAQLVQFASELRAQATSITINSDDSMVLQDGSFSFCPPTDNSWNIASSRIDILPEKGVGEARNAVLSLGPVPIFYLPWISFPIDDQRRSGFLYPQLSTSSNAGLYLATPYYLNLAPNYDAIVTPHYKEHRGLHLTSQGRYLGSSGIHQSNTLITVDDKQSSNHSWYADYSFSGQFNEQLSADIKLARASDIALFDNYEYASTQADANKVTSEMVFNYQVGIDALNKVTLGFKQHQQLTTNAPTYNLLPYAHLSGNGELAEDAIWQYALSYDHFQRGSHASLTGLSAINGQRVHLTPSMQYAWQSSYAYSKSTLSLPTSFYQLTDTPAGVASRQGRSIYQLELDSGLLFERPTANGGQQTLEPRLYWAYAPYQEQDDLPVFDTSAIGKPLYQANRFNGPDRIGDTNRVTLGVSSRVLAADGKQQAKFSLAQIHYLDDRQVQLSSSTATATETSSPFYGQMDYQFNDKLSSNLSVDWNNRTNEVEAMSANVRYRAASNQIVATSYTETASSIQTQTSVIWPLAPQWTLFAQQKDDITNSRQLDRIAGLEYANCCYKVRLVNRDWYVDQATGDEHGLFLELELKGLGDSDTRLFGTGDADIQEFMKNITGYNERFN